MLTLMEAAFLASTGQPLPQNDLPVVSEETCGAVQDGASALLNGMLRTLEDGGDTLAFLTSGVADLSRMYGWWAVCGVSAVELAHYYTTETVDGLPTSVDPDTRTLLKAFAVAAGHPSEEGIWTIPLAMLASLGEERAQFLVECALYCAGFEAVRKAADS